MREVIIFYNRGDASTPKKWCRRKKNPATRRSTTNNTQWLITDCIRQKKASLSLAVTSVARDNSTTDTRREWPKEWSISGGESNNEKYGLKMKKQKIEAGVMGEAN